MRTRFLIVCLVIAAAVALLVPVLLPGRMTVAITAVLYFPVVLGISALAGYANQVSGGHAAFFGTGAYVTGIASSSGHSPWLSMMAGVAASVILAVLIGLPVLRLRGHFLVLATISVNIVFVVVIRQWSSLTGGSSGLLGIQPLEIFGHKLTSYEPILYLAVVWAVVAAVGTHNVVNSAPGRALKSLGASEPAATSMGISQSNYAAFLFAWSAFLAGGSGALYAEWMRFLSPSTFDIHLSITLLLMAVIGGVGSIGGAAVGVVAYVSATEAIGAALGGSMGAKSPVVEGIIFGTLLLFLVILRPAGIASFFPRRTKPARSAIAHELDPTATHLVEPTDSRDAPGLVVKDLSQSFGPIQVLDRISLEAHRGEVLALVGPNGAGKSTLLNLVSGLIRPTGGQVTFGGKPLLGLAPHQIARRGVSRSFQTPQLVHSLSVRDNVAVGLHVRSSGAVRTFLSVLGLNYRDERRIAEGSVASLQRTAPSTAWLTTPIGSLPFGQRRWVEMARAAASSPELILLDEPASGLTAEERDHLVALVRSYAEAGAAVVLVEHDMALVRSVADRAVVLHHGTVLAYGPTEQTLNDPQVQEAYLGSNLEKSHQTRGTDANAEIVLRVQNLSTGYGDLGVIEGATFDVKCGQISALLGPNGAGKTTLLRGITGQLPVNGSIELGDEQVANRAVDSLARQGLVLVPEGRELIPGLTVAEHLRLAGTRRSHPGGIKFELDAIHALFPILRERAGQMATSLSGGQQQMLAIARVLRMQPRVLLIDEPLLGLSPIAVQEVLAAIRELADQGLAVVLAEQQARTVRPYVNKVLRVEHGVVVVDDASPQKASWSSASGSTL